MDEKLKNENGSAINRNTKRLLNFGDSIFSAFLVAPLVITHWFGTWMFMERHGKHFPALQTFLFGTFCLLLFTLSRGNIYGTVLSVINIESAVLQRICKCFVVKLYLYAFSIVCIMTWRSVFALLLEYSGKVTHKPLSIFAKGNRNSNFVPDAEIWSALAQCLFAGVLLICCRSLRCITAPPFVIAEDSKLLAFVYPTRFKTDVSNHQLLETYRTILLPELSNECQFQFNGLSLLRQTCYDFDWRQLFGRADVTSKDEK